jgi:16S rRNA (guanine527-N7)-methyltransferase
MGAAPALTLGAAELDQLRTGAASLGIALDQRAIERFLSYAALLERWRAIANLISCRNAAELVTRHLLDSLAPAWIAGAAQSIADLGSGAGLPGIPLAIVAPRRRTILVEARHRRASFLREVARRLELGGVEVRATRAEEVDSKQPPVVDVVVSRAVWSSTDEMLAVCDRWVRGGGVVLCMRTADHARANDGRVEAWSGEGPVTYRIDDERLRRIDIFRKASGVVSRET